MFSILPDNDAFVIEFEQPEKLIPISISSQIDTMYTEHDSPFDGFVSELHESIMDITIPDMSLDAVMQSTQNGNRAQALVANTADQVVSNKIAVRFRMLTGNLNWCVLYYRFWLGAFSKTDKTLQNNVGTLKLEFSAITHIISMRFKQVVFDGIDRINFAYQASDLTKDFTCNFTFGDFEISINERNVPEFLPV